MNLENNKEMTRQQKIEAFLLNPEKVTFESIEEFSGAINTLLKAFEGVDLATLEMIQGEDGQTPQRGVHYMTPDDIKAIEAFINSRLPVIGKDIASPDQVRAFVQAAVDALPRIKGDKGDEGKRGKPGAAGSPDSPEEIIKKIRSLGRNQGFKIKDIRGLPEVVDMVRRHDDEITAIEEQIKTKSIVMNPGGGSGGEGGDDATAIHYDGVDEFDTIAEDATPAAGDYILAERASDGEKIKIPFSAIGDGADGRTVLNGSGAPDVGDGIDGDFYIDTDDFEIYGPKTGGVWGSATPLEGPQGPAGSGSGDMLEAMYDPNGVNDDAFDMENMVEGSTKKILTTAERAKIGHLSVTQAVDLDAIETNSAASKVKTDHITVTQAVDLDAIESRVNALDAAVILKGTWDASAGTFPGSGTAQAGDSWIVSVGGTVNSVVFTAGDRIIAILDNASTTTFASNWFKADYTDLFTTQTLGDLINGASAKTTPVDADMVGLMDSAASNIAKKLSWANIKATLKTYFDTLYQPLNSNLTTIAGLTATTNNFIVSVGSAWASRTPAQVKTTLSLDNVDNTSNTTERAASAALTNKDLKSSTNTFAEVTTGTSSATPTPTGGSKFNELYMTAQAANAVIAAPTGTPANGHRLLIRITPTGTYTLGFNAIFEWIGITALTGMTSGKEIYIGAVYNSTASKWQIIACAVKA